VIGTTAIIAALSGAVAAGFLKTADQFFERRRRRESTLVALASEVQAIKMLVDSQGYFEQFAKLAHDIRNGRWDRTSYVIDIRGSYFTVYHSLAAEMGLLKPNHVSKIVGFYTFCQSAVDATRPDGPLAVDADAEDQKSNILGVEGVLMAVKLSADEITKFPKSLLPVIENV
jgi:hypothetical protein